VSAPLILLFCASAPPYAEAASQQAGIERIYVVPMSHLDIGFTDTPAAVAAKMVAAVEDAVRQADQDPDFVWNIETFWQLEQWLATAPEAALEVKLVALVRGGRIGVGAAYVTPHSGLMSEWALARLCEPACMWARKSGLELSWAVLNDVPGFCCELPRYLAAAGVKYLVLGVNQAFTPPLPEKSCNQPFWWEAPTGERVLTWISCDGYTEAFTQMGFDPDTARFFCPEKFRGDDPVAITRQGVETVLEGYRKRRYPYRAIMVLSAFDNWGLGSAGRLPGSARRWNTLQGVPRIILSTPAAFFEYLLAEKRDFPVYRGDFAGAWEQVKLGVPTSIRRMRAAEKLLAARDATAADPAVRLFLILCEHTFGLGPPWPGLLSEEQALQHNREQAEFVKRLPGSWEPWPVRGEQRQLDVDHDGQLRPNHLYLSTDGVGLWQFVHGRLEPLEPQAWTALPPRRSADGTWQLRHRIDRRKLPESARVVWAWPLRSEARNLRPQVRSASGWMQLPDDRLTGELYNGWFSAQATRLDGVEIAADLPLAFCISPESYPRWVFALCLSQSRQAVFKEGSARVLEFEEAYPGEEPVLELTIEVRPAPSGSN